MLETWRAAYKPDTKWLRYVHGTLLCLLFTFFLCRPNPRAFDSWLRAATDEKGNLREVEGEERERERERVIPRVGKEYKYYHRMEECSIKMLLVVEIFVEITQRRGEERTRLFNKERGNFVILI